MADVLAAPRRWVSCSVPVWSCCQAIALDDVAVGREAARPALTRRAAGRAALTRLAWSIRSRVVVGLVPRTSQVRTLRGGTVGGRERSGTRGRKLCLTRAWFSCSPRDRNSSRARVVVLGLYRVSAVGEVPAPLGGPVPTPRWRSRPEQARHDVYCAPVDQFVGHCCGMASNCWTTRDGERSARGAA